MDTVWPQDSRSEFAHFDMGKSKARLGKIHHKSQGNRVARRTGKSIFWKGDVKFQLHVDMLSRNAPRSGV